MRAAGARGMTTASSVEVTRGAAVLGNLEPGPAAPTPFQTAGWYRSWISEAAESEGATPLMVTVLTAAGGRSCIGLQLHETQSGPVIRPLSWPWADYHCACRESDPAVDAEQALAAAIDGLQRCEGARLDLPDVAEGDLLHRAALALGAHVRPGSPVVSIDLTDGGHVAALVGRKETVRKGRQLARLGDVALVHWREPGDLPDRLRSFFAMHAAQWRGRPEAVAPFDGGVVDRTFAAVAAQPDAGVVLSELCLDSVPIAAYYGFLHRGTYWAYRTAFDGAYRRLSPGQQLIAGMIVDFAAAGIQTFDLMRGDYPYKLGYASRVSANVHAERDCP
jgi:CelD/BcsL family acetyltransferase involved in cellulose biosynthesis